jgi:dTMP kinase
MFIVLEGVEGSGKSTQARRLAAALGDRAILTKEPGGTPLGRSIRDMLLHPGHVHLAVPTEVLLYFADRAQHVADVVRPNLERGRIVVSDRYVASSLAYQGAGRGVAQEALRAVAELATGGLAPDLYFYERVRDGYHAMIAADPAHWITIDGAALPEAVFEQIKVALRARGIDGV